MNISSISCNKVPEVEEGLLTSEDIKSPNFQEKSSPSAAGMVAWQPDPYLLFSWPLLFPLSLAGSLSKYTGAPGEGVQPDCLQREAALNCCGSKYSESVEDDGRDGVLLVFHWCSIGVLLVFCCPQPQQPTEGKQTPLSFKKKLSQGLLADASALLADVDTFVPYPSSTTQLWTIKLSKKSVWEL